MNKLTHKLKKTIFMPILFICLALSPVSAQEQNEFGTMKPSESSQEKRFPVGKKFLIAMGGVGVSIAIIYLLLLGYKKLQAQKVVAFSKEDYTNDLNSPKNLSEAMNIFLSKSK